MTLQEKIKKDLNEAMKAKQEDKKSVLRVILGEMSRLESKELSDDDVIRLLKKLVKSEKEVVEKKGEQSSFYLEFIESYLPKAASEEDISKWVADNIDFSQFKNKMQAMGAIMKHFGSAADGNTVKSILSKL